MDTTHPGHRERVDGNAAGGLLLELFGRDMTGARAACGRCDREAELADAVAELDRDGMILLCRGCGHTLLTYLCVDDRCTLALGGLTRLEWAATGR
ncbi:DUF6510 family protein [Microbacterium foliorum]|uniref:DUF6510 family protein n=1 Tax=Microbacterium foliorum TaxID=104336 RepID=UPI0028D3C32D|nr:DUF6510 family protein [Microbacterium foliorum]